MKSDSLKSSWTCSSLLTTIRHPVALLGCQLSGQTSPSGLKLALLVPLGLASWLSSPSPSCHSVYVSLSPQALLIFHGLHQRQKAKAVSCRERAGAGEAEGVLCGD